MSVYLADLQDFRNKKYIQKIFLKKARFQLLMEIVKLNIK